MPRKILPNVRGFASFDATLREHGFRRISPIEFKNDFGRLGLIAPSHREGREVGYTFSANGLEVVVWTTFLASEGAARDTDEGWVLIKDGDDVRYFSHPLHRTRNFLRKLNWTARIAQWKVEHRPHCQKCGARMDIAYGKGLKARYWRCAKGTTHRRPVSLDWDYGIPSEAREFLRRQRMARKYYRNRLAKLGKLPGEALRRRISWKIARQENLIPSR